MLLYRGSTRLAQIQTVVPHFQRALLVTPVALAHLAGQLEVVAKDSRSLLETLVVCDAGHLTQLTFYYVKMCLRDMIKLP
jgi:hypothetical protein